MTMQELLDQFRELEDEEKLVLLHDLWTELSDEQDTRPLTDAERSFLEARTIQIEQDPRRERPWKEVRDEILIKR